MPRRSLPQPAATATMAQPSTSHASSSNDPFLSAIGQLRRDWRFAAVCQFLVTFEEAFGMSGFKTDSLEHDLAASTYETVPNLMRRLLYTLTLDKSVSIDNWQDRLRIQYARRTSPEEDGPNPLGSEEEPTNWETLPLATKVRSIHDLCEWQWVDAERFRKLLRSDEDAENWRIYPVGYDGQDNTYWLFDDNRLWVQHPPPPPPPKARPPPKKGSKRARAEAAAAKRAADKAKAVAKPAANGNRTSRRTQPQPQPPPAKRPRTSRSNAAPAPAASSPRGSRSSRRLRGNADDDGWEQIPPELLDSGLGSNGVGKHEDDDDDSELSEPPSQDEELEEVTKQDDAADETVEGDTMDLDDSTLVEQDDAAAGGSSGNSKAEPNDAEPSWIEFEAIAVTRSEWEAMQTRFAKSKHPDEKAFHKLLTTDLCPRILADIAEAEKQAAMEAALASRKRSSRIATKEAEREAEQKQLEARAAMEERMKRIRNEEEAAARREEEARQEEKRREDRLREREDRIKAREMEAERKAIMEMEERERREKMREMRAKKREMIAAGELDPTAAKGAQSGGTENNEDEDWDLACEVCLKQARNPELDQDEQIVCSHQVLGLV
ncbi:hypothetical protein BDZ90DRAFT_276179 [Jaminaea rosea]|uniref:WHIM1 domain-containing protein n=1 Tax=Jaminaea rosea TaxID=1569628 RepID=A0A316UHN8_9BASI|nr:hypothetical protein BDZ90DRAFT_276179 [Jaminaea rosea]PWN24719.1 hypothetical protein BDZ90DRAFT_276179 [Jaminaea rosea]